VLKKGGVLKCRSNQKDGIWTQAHHREIQKARRSPFFLHKRDQESVLCVVALDELENAAQSSDLSKPALTRIFDAHRQLIELRAAQKLNAGQVESNGSVLVRAEDI
jgi:hypothetical protein